MMDFNDAPNQDDFGIIPDNTVATVCMSIKKGGFNNAKRGWNDGWVTKSKSSESVFLACKFTVLEGKYNGKKVYHNIGLYSPKGPAWEQQGRAFIKALLNSSHGIYPKDNTPRAKEARRIEGFADLEGLTFMAIIGVETDSKEESRNVIKKVIEPGHSKYVQPVTKAIVPSVFSPAAEYVEYPEEPFYVAPF